MRLLFYNNWHNGDLHFTRQFIKDIMNKTKCDEYFYMHVNSENIFNDIPGLKIIKPNEYCINENVQLQVNNDIYINTWIGVLFSISPMKDLKPFDFPALPSFYVLFKHIYNILNIPIDPMENYIPEINYEYYEIENINNYLKKNKIRILIESGEGRSYQANFVDFFNLIDRLSNDYPDIDFITTKKIELNKENVLSTSDIIKSNKMDLNEISYLSTFCSVIIGRASGPYSFTQVKNNLRDSNKTYIGICEVLNNVVWDIRSECYKIWINKYDTEHIYNIIHNEIEKKIKINHTDFQIRTEYNNTIHIKTSKDIYDAVSIDFINNGNIKYNYTSKLIKNNEIWVLPFNSYNITKDNMILRFSINNKILFEKTI